MKFEKMENGTLRCILTREDLEQNEIELEDFFSNTPTVREFLEKLIRIAEEEVGYKSDGNMMSIQATIMPDGEIELTFAEGKISNEDLLEHIRNMVSPVKKRLEQKALSKEETNLLKEVTNPKAVSKEEREGYTYLLTFVSFSSVRQFCRVLSMNTKTQSRLYYLEHKKQYFLWADLNNTTRGYVYEFVAASMEYAESVEKDSMRSTYLEEHANIIVKEQALETLAQL